MIASALFTATTAVSQSSIPSSVNELVNQNKKLKREAVKLFMLTEQLRGELAISHTQIDSCDELVQSYEYLLERCNDVYQNYDALVAEKNNYIVLDAKEIKLLKKQILILRTKLIATGVVVPAAAAGAAVGLTYLFMTLRK